MAIASSTRLGWGRTADSAADQYARDVRLWAAAIWSPDANPRDRGTPNPILHGGMLRRLFLIMKTAGVQYTTGGEKNAWSTTALWQAWDKPLAAVLSHGGRVIIQWPRGGYKHQLWSFLLTGNRSKVESAMEDAINAEVRSATGLKSRTWSSHGMSETNEKIYEKKGGAQNIARAFNWHTHQFGVNVALGGIGGMDAKGNAVNAAGKYGHMLMIYRVGSNSALMLGVENKAYDVKGDTHLGAGHSADGSAQKMSATNGLKWEDLGERDGVAVPSTYNSMRVDIEDTDDFLIGLVAEEAKYGQLGNGEKQTFIQALLA